MSKEKILTNIYQIDRNICSFKGLNNLQIIEKIKYLYNKNIEKEESQENSLEENKFLEREIKNEIDTHGFEIKLFTNLNRPVPNWLTFLKPILPEDSDLLKNRNLYNSYLAFFIKGDYIFTICGGLGNFAIQNYINQNFGIEIISRLVEKNVLIKSTQERGFIGNVLSSTRFYRGDYKLSDEDDFGKIYKAIQTELGEDILNKYFDFPKTQFKKGAGCIAKSSFQINKLITFDKLLTIIDKLIEIYEMPVNFDVNKVQLVNNKGNNIKKIKWLERILKRKIFNAINNNELLDFDFFNKDIESYFSANKYCISYRNKEIKIRDLGCFSDLNELINELKNNNVLKLNTLKEFKKIIKNIIITTFDEDGKQITKGRFLKHIHGEIKTKKGDVYFYIDEKWYLLKDSFIDDLNSMCEEIINNTDTDLELEKYDWKTDKEENSEEKYIEKYINTDGFIVMHRICEDNIELCDLIKYDDKNCYLVHIKKGFNNKMRDLSSQIYISARRLQAIKSTNENYIEELYSKMKSYNNSPDLYLKGVSSQNITKEEFVNIFKNKKINYCLCFIDESKSERDIKKDIKKFDSNIAKFSLMELNKNMKGFNFSLNIIQI